MKRRLQRLAVRFQEQRGQSIVLLAGAMVALLAFVGLAVDAGVIYMGSIHLSRSVDAAALAGVVELPEDDADFPSVPFEQRTSHADIKALGFLAANGIEATEAVTGTEFFQSNREQGVIGSYRYRITATHQVDLYFLPLVDFNYVKLRDTALADYNPWVDIYTDQSGALGVLETANQSFKGQSEESARGDAFSPTDSPWYPELQGKYVYRIYVPHEYPYDTVRVEILDPEDYDASPFPPSVSATVYFTGPITMTIPCSGPLCPTGSPYQPLWFLGLDEGTSNNPIQFTLFYYKLLADGRLERQNIARYTSTGGNNSQGTDMMWVSPGADQAWDYAGSGVPNDAQESDWPGDGNFEIQVRGSDGRFGTAGSEVPGIYKGARPGMSGIYDVYIYMEAESQGDHEENSFELWAGPDVYTDVPGNVNDRNVYTIVNGLEQAHGPAGVVVYAVGHMAFNSNALNRVEMQLADIPSSWAERRIRIEYFDVDTDTQPPFIFYFDTMLQRDWSMCYDDAGDCDTPAGRQPCETTVHPDGGVRSNCPDTRQYGYTCADFGEDPGFESRGKAWLVDHYDGGADECRGQPSNNQWRTYEFLLPPREVFYGGRLMVSYGGGNTDNVTFRIMVESVPRLEE